VATWVLLLDMLVPTSVTTQRTGPSALDVAPASTDVSIVVVVALVIAVVLLLAIWARRRRRPFADGVSGATRARHAVSVSRRHVLARLQG
jgi:MYXO-CTERM domain-containing protein